MSYIFSFCDNLLHQKRYSNHTITAYKKDLEQFKEFILSDFELEDIRDVNSSTIRSWIVKLIEEETSPRTINRKISTLKSFYKYLLKNKEIKISPLLKVVTPKTSKRLPVFIGETDMQDLFNEVEFEESFEGARDKLILELFYASGIRLSELVNLNIHSIDYNNSTIKVLGKRNKERLIPFGNNIRKTIIDYLKKREQLSAASSSLFLTKKGEIIYPKLVYRIVNYYLSTVTTASKKSPHVLRHTFATHMLNNGADLNSIKEILGHANLSATQVYTHNTIEKLKNIHKQAHPKAL
jgi:integrase/recombinase XerC